MAGVYLTSTNRASIAGSCWTNFSRLKKSALECDAPMHNLEEDPEDADIILFWDSQSITQADVRSHELTRRFGAKVFVYSSQDHDVPILPGVYACAENDLPPKNWTESDWNFPLLKPGLMRRKVA